MINELSKIYEKWGKDNNIESLLSADELLSENELNETQTIWVKEFIKVWDMAQDVEYFIEANCLTHTKGGK